MLSTTKTSIGPRCFSSSCFFWHITLRSWSWPGTPQSLIDVNKMGDLPINLLIFSSSQRRRPITDAPESKRHGTLRLQKNLSIYAWASLSGLGSAMLIVPPGSGQRTYGMIECGQQALIGILSARGRSSRSMHKCGDHQVYIEIWRSGRDCGLYMTSEVTFWGWTVALAL